MNDFIAKWINKTGWTVSTLPHGWVKADHHVLKKTVEFLETAYPDEILLPALERVSAQDVSTWMSVGLKVKLVKHKTLHIRQHDDCVSVKLEYRRKQVAFDVCQGGVIEQMFHGFLRGATSQPLLDYLIENGWDLG